MLGGDSKGGPSPLSGGLQRGGVPSLREPVTLFGRFTRCHSISSKAIPNLTVGTVCMKLNHWMLICLTPKGPRPLSFLPYSRVWIQAINLPLALSLFTTMGYSKCQKAQSPHIVCAKWGCCGITEADTTRRKLTSPIVSGQCSPFFFLIIQE